VKVGLCNGHEIKHLQPKPLAQRRVVGEEDQRLDDEPNRLTLANQNIELARTIVNVGVVCVVRVDEDGELVVLGPIPNLNHAQDCVRARYARQLVTLSPRLIASLLSLSPHKVCASEAVIGTVLWVPGFVTPGQTSSLDDTWATPQATFDELNAEFRFGLDAAALESSAKCDMWYGPDHPDPSMRDAFFCDWAATGLPVWLNPPYGRTIGAWMQRAYEMGARTTVVCLVPARTDTRWFHDWVLGKAELRFIKGRLKFGDAPHPAPFPSMVVVYRPPV